jgi:predicted RNA-binding Zn ribbon-like protein
MNVTEILKSDRWDLDAGHRALDFANTMDWHLSDHPRDRLRSYEDFTDWAREGRVISPAQKRTLDEEAKAHPRQAEKALENVRQYRDALQRVFDAQAGDTKPDPADLDLIKGAVARAVANASFQKSAGNIAFTWSDLSRDLEYPLGALAWVSLELLTSEGRKMIGQCADERGCGFLFLDTSKNHSRRWCSMESCGNRAKAKRHYASKGKKLNQSP